MYDKTKGLINEYDKSLIAKDGFLYGVLSNSNNLIRILDIPDNSNYSTSFLLLLNDSIGEFDYGYSLRDFHTINTKNLSESELMNFNILNKEEIIKICLKYVFLLRPHLLNKTLVGYELPDGIEEGFEFKYIPNTYDAIVGLPNGHLYRLQIKRGLLTIKDLDLKEDILNEFELDEFLYRDSILFHKRFRNFDSECFNLSNNFEVGSERFNFFLEYLNIKKDLTLKLENYLSTLKFN